MIALERLRVSLTKNGFGKIAALVQRHPRWEILNHVEGKHAGINLARSQVANILGYDTSTGSIPQFWDELRGQDRHAVRAYCLFAVILSHHELISAFQSGKPGTFVGRIRRDELGNKAYTNLVYTMNQLGLCELERGADSIDYDLYRAVYDLRECGGLMGRMLASKLARCGWIDPDANPGSPHDSLIPTCLRLGLHRVFGMDKAVFTDWLNGQMEIDPPGDGSRTVMRSTRRGSPRKPR